MKAFIFAILFLSCMVLSQRRGTHYQDPFNKGCMSDEQMLGDNSKATCSASCNTYACPNDYPSDGHGLNPKCLPRNAYGNRMCALECPLVSYCPHNARCTKISLITDENQTKRNRVLQKRVSAKVC